MADLASGHVWAPDGSKTELRRQSVAALVVLAARRGETVTKSELFASVWGDIVVTDDSLVQCIGEIRRALGVSRNMLMTLPREGYRLEPQIVRAEVYSRRWVPGLVWILLLVLTVSIILVVRQHAGVPSPADIPFGGPVVAVLPFENLSGGERWDRLSRAITTDITGDLAQNAWLFVLAGATTQAFANQTPSELSKTLGVDYIVQGSLLSESGIVRVTASTIEAASGRQLWSKRWSGPTADLLLLEQEAAEALTAEVASSWSGVIAVADRTRARGRGTVDLTAYELAQIAVERANLYTPEDFDAAIDLLKQAVAIDPNFGNAWAILSYCYYNRIAGDLTAEEQRHLMRARVAAAQQALRVSPDQPMPLIQAGEVASEKDRNKAETMFRRAAALAPNDADLLSYVASKAPATSGLADDALTWIERAMRLNPKHPNWYWWNRGNVMFALGRYAEAADAYARGPDVVDVRALEAASLALDGRSEDARVALTATINLEPDFTSQWFANLLNWEPHIETLLLQGLILAGSN